jgi:hypothetical protein
MILLASLSYQSNKVCSHSCAYHWILSLLPRTQNDIPLKISLKSQSF